MLMQVGVQTCEDDVTSTQKELDVRPHERDTTGISGGETLTDGTIECGSVYKVRR